MNTKKLRSAVTITQSTLIIVMMVLVTFMIFQINNLLLQQ